MTAAHEEMKLRQQHIRWALMRAMNAVGAEDWFTTRAAIDEAQIITRAVQDELSNDTRRWSSKTTDAGSSR